MKILSIVFAGLLFVGFAGAASAECSWGKSSDTTAESQIPLPEDKAGT